MVFFRRDTRYQSVQVPYASPYHAPGSRSIQEESILSVKVVLFIGSRARSLLFVSSRSLSASTSRLSSFSSHRLVCILACSHCIKSIRLIMTQAYNSLVASAFASSSRLDSLLSFCVLLQPACCTGRCPPPLHLLYITRIASHPILAAAYSIPPPHYGGTTFVWLVSSVIS
ncbi:hypothetical protein NEOLEDRAFT_838200 [Neolentinus lepideus HHB14362 ss-1]|uniref:Uncharacterized protein n=1 Tax=Neolentinus lepideus HHB14362 ss-1 TaxID=1314782 RepID=A0A165P6C1_9AGAM|nr:hypothetical protein NEOLEDRAFT_838200 [Neolentinus lepideus HHB14362 ss-1]